MGGYPWRGTGSCYAVGTERSKVASNAGAGERVATYIDGFNLLCRRRHNRVYADLFVMPMFGVLSQVRLPGWFLRSA